jgi:hypothetical protein
LKLRGNGVRFSLIPPDFPGAQPQEVVVTPKDWIKIVAGMLAIFAVGMFAVSGINAGKRKVNDIAHSSSAITVPMLGVSFKMNDASLGGMKKLRVERSAPEVVESFHLTVQLDDGVDVNQFDDCELTVKDARQIDDKTTFTCLTNADPGFEELVQFGTITFLPSGETHRLMLPMDVRDEIQQSGQAKGTQVTTADGDGNVSIKVNGEQIVDIQGGETGGRVLIKDPATGKVVVDIQGSDAGGSVKINGKAVTPPTPPATPKAPAAGN